MANTILTPEIIAREALMQLRNNAVMAGLVYRDYSSEFVAGIGDTITIRTPSKFEVNEFTGEGPIEVQSLTETSTSIKMDKILDTSFEVTSAEMAMDIADFSKQFLIPAMQGFNDKIDNYILTLADGISQTVTVSGAAGRDQIVDARKFLTKAPAPLTERRMVYNSDIEADFLKTDLFTNASAVGDEGTALREASLGRKYGMDFYVDQNLDSAHTAKAVAFHKNAFAMVTRQLQKPLGAAKSAIVNYDGFSLRVVYDYDINKKKDVVSIDMLCGFKTLDPKLAAIMTAG